jgi:trehalose 6-phosphate phosphatase
MKVLNPLIDYERFCKRLPDAPEKALLLDYDGTLAPFHQDPSKALPYSGVPEVLDRIMSSGKTRVVVVSGRWTKDLLPLLSLRRQPEIWGSHGLERLRKDGSYEIAPIDEKALRGLVLADEWVKRLGLSAHSEEKPGCLAVHWRGLKEARVAEIRNQVAPGWSALAQKWGLILGEFDGGIELRVPGRDKGDAVRTICEEMGNSIPVAYLGDDRTDEDAFRAIKGLGLGVLVREEIRESAADLWLRPPDELLEFLSIWAAEAS